MTSLLNDLSLLEPEMFVAGAAMLILLLGAFWGNGGTRPLMVIGVMALLAAALEVGTNPLFSIHATAFTGMFVTDVFAALLKVLVLLGLAATLMISLTPLRQESMVRFEYPVLVMLSGVGMMLMISAHDFMTVYVGLEMSALPLYVLAAFRREAAQGAEAGVKYFVLGALSSGLLLFGISLIYGFAGTTNFAQLAAMPTMGAGLVVGMAFVLAGFAFKLSAVPFHMWTPDVYQGAPSPVTALFAMVPKIAAVGMMVRMLFGPFAAHGAEWGQIVAFLALASIMWGALAAIAQTNIKRLLAYGSIGNIGYALIGLLAMNVDGVSATLFYMAVYLVMTAGTFAALIAVRRDGVMIENIADLAGLSRTRPFAAYVLAAMLFALSGLPPFAGFLGKLMVFRAAVDAGQYAVAIAGVVVSVIAAYYYLRIIKVMFFDKPREEVEGKLDVGQVLVALIAVGLILGMMFVPGLAFAPFDAAAHSLFPKAS